LITEQLLKTSNLEILKYLFAYQQYLHACINRKLIYAPTFFERVYSKAEDYLKRPAKHTVSRFQEGICCICGTPIPKNTEGDHLIARARGGDDYEYNKVPLCKYCNSSKRDRDLLEWWFLKGNRLIDLDPYVLAVYLKNEYRLLSKQRELYAYANEYLARAYSQGKEILNYLSIRYKIANDVEQGRITYEDYFKDPIIKENEKILFDHMINEKREMIKPTRIEFYIFYENWVNQHENFY